MRKNGHKYGAKPTTVDGIRFASKAEARRYGELKLLEKAGEIARLELQPKFDLHIAAKVRGCPQGVRHPSKVCTYIADFSYIDRNGKAVYEDTKGFRTPVYRLKKKMVEKEYGITITEVA